MSESVISVDEDLTIVISDGPSADRPIQLCDEHQIELDFYKLDLEQLNKTVIMVFTLAARTVGTKALVSYRCPLCALKNFPYLHEAIKITAPEKINGH